MWRRSAEIDATYVRPDDEGDIGAPDDGLLHGLATDNATFRLLTEPDCALQLFSERQRQPLNITRAGEPEVVDYFRVYD
jgi:hypothetical protein